MRRSDFADYAISAITPAMIEGSGANLDEVKVGLVMTLDAYSKLIGKQVVILPNGLTTGQHASPEHKRGEAVDISFREQDGPVTVRHLVPMAYWVGFRGVGVYWNGTAYSMHLDIGSRFRQWAKSKSHRSEAWTDLALIRDPAEQ